MYTYYPSMTDYYMNTPQQLMDDLTSFNEQDLLLTTGFYPEFSPTTTTTSKSEYTSSNSSISSSSNGSCSPDSITCQYLSSSPSYNTESNLDFLLYYQQEIEPVKTTKPTIMTTHNNLEGRPYPCHLCNRAFARKHDLQRHIRVHTGDKPYSCPCCKKAFARTDALKRHFRMEEQCRSSEQVQNMKSFGRRKFVRL